MSYYEQPRKNYAPPPVANITKESLLVAFAWYLDAANTIKEVNPQDATNPQYSEEFINLLMEDGVLKGFGATDKEIEMINDFRTSNPERFNNGIYYVMKRALVNTYGNTGTVGIDEEGNVVIAPLLTKDGKVNLPAMMKTLRKIKADNAKRSVYIKNGYQKDSTPFSSLPNEFIALTDREEFLNGIGLPEESKEVIIKTINKYKATRSDEMADILRRTLYKYLNGRVNDYDSIPCIFAGQKIAGEFRHRQTKLEKFIEGFRTENAQRGRMKKEQHLQQWPPFSDQFLVFAQDPKILEAAGFPEEGINKIMSFKTLSIVDGKTYISISDRDRNNMSLTLANYGTKSPIIKNGVRPRTILDDNSGLVAVIRELAKENGESYAMKTQGSYAKMKYSDSLIDQLFGIKYLDGVKQAEPNAKNIRIVGNWIASLPDDSPLFQIGMTRDRLLSATEATENNENASFEELLSVYNDPDAFHVQRAFSVLLAKKYVSGASDAFWNGMSESQANMFRATIGKDIYDLAKEYKKAHPDLFPQSPFKKAKNKGYRR